MEWIVGGNLWTEKFDQRQGDPDNDLSFSNTTTGVFVQNTWNMATQWTLETGLRGDYQSQYGAYLLPRFSLLYEPNERITFRTGGGLGYKTPTQFTEDKFGRQLQMARNRGIEPKYKCAFILYAD